MVAKGMSLADVGRKLNVDTDRVRIWSADVPKSKYLGLIKHNQLIREDLINSEKHLASKRWGLIQAKCLCGLLYGCEGSKYPAHNGVAFTNSDPRLIKSFINLMRKAYSLDETKWRLHLQIHSHQDYEKLKNYWSELLNISNNQFFKPTVTKARGRKHRKEYLGTCTAKIWRLSDSIKANWYFRGISEKMQ